MICPQCFDDGKGEVDLRHKSDEEAYHDPGAYDGCGTRTVCWLECPRCNYQTDCDGHADD